MTPPTEKPARRSLADAVHGAAIGQDATPQERQSGWRPPPSRSGKKGVLIHLPVIRAKALRQLALDEDTTVQALGVEAFEALLRDRGR